MLHDAMPYDPMQGQDHETVQVRNSPIFTFPLLHHLQYGFDRSGFLVLVFCHCHKIIIQNNIVCFCL